MRYFATAFFILAFSLALSAQTISATPSILNFSVQVNGTTASQPVFINSSGGNTTWSVLNPIAYTGTPGWITFGATNGPAPGSVSVGVNSAGLTAGLYSAAVTLLAGSGATTSFTANLCVGTVQACTPAISVSPTSMTFSGTQSNPPASQVLTISSSNGQTNWTATPSTTDGGNWLLLSLGSGDTTNNPTTNVSVNLAALPTNSATYSGTITVATSGGNILVPISLTVGQVLSNSISLVLSRTTYTFYGTTGGAVPGQQLIITDSAGVGGLAWTATVSGNTPWLSLASSNGSTPTNNTINVDTTNLPAGVSSGSITVSAPGSSNGAVTVNVTVNLAADSGKTLILKNAANQNLSSILFIVTAGSGATLQTVNIGNTGSGTVQWSAAPATDTGGPWLSVVPATGSTPGSTSVTLNPSGLAAGNYSGSITFSGVGVASSSNNVVPVAVLVSAAPGLAASPASIDFAAAPGDVIPVKQLAITSTAPGSVFNWSAVSAVTSPLGSNWLTIDVAAGSTPGTINVTANATGLASGSYTGTITISAANSPTVVVPVTLTISSQPSLSVNSTQFTFTGTAGQSVTPQSLQISTTLNALPWTSVVAVQTPAGGNWLQLSATFGTTPSSININPITTNLAAGTYNGTISISALGASNTQLVNVTLILAPGATLASSPTSLSFTGAAGVTLPSQPIAVTNSITGTGSIGWTATATVTSPAGGSWLSVSPASGTTPGSANVTVSTVNLTQGTYTGTIRIASTGATNTVSIPVTLTVTTPTITVGSNTLTFAGTAGGNVAPQTLNISSSGGTANPLNWTAAVATQSGGTWLSILPTSGQTPSSAIVSVASAPLAPGNYTGTIVISASDGNSSQTVNVSLTINALSIIALSPATLQFVAARPVLSQQSATFDVQNLGIGTMSFTANASTISGGNWLSVTPNSGTAPATLTVNVNAQGLAAGSYIGAVNITPTGSTNALNAPQTLVVTLSVDVPVIFNGGIVNGASFAPDNTAVPDELVSLFGANLASSTVSATGLPLPTTLGSTQVLVNGNPVPLFFVSAGQINFVFPEAAGTSAVVSVVVNGQRSLNTIVNVAAADPGIFPTAGGQGLGQVLNQDFSANSPAHPASAGQVVQMFVTGLGVTFPRQTPGQPGNSAAPFNNTVLQPTVTIGGINAPVVFSAAAPGLAGVYQVNATVPAGLPTGGFAVMQLTINGKTSNAVNVAIK